MNGTQLPPDKPPESSRDGFDTADVIDAKAPLDDLA
jgi:hypothetical protein